MPSRTAEPSGNKPVRSNVLSLQQARDTDTNMRANILILCAAALAAPVHAAGHAETPRVPAETAISFTNAETAANGLGWKRFVHIVTTDGRTHGVPALAGWAMMIAGLAGAGVLLRRRSSFRI